MENSKLRWEKDFSHNWSILKNVNTNLMSMSLDSENTHIISPDKEGLSSLNEVISNLGGITSQIDELTEYKANLNNRSKLNTNLSYNFNYFRNLVLVVDLTERMNMNDYKPTRHKFLYKNLEKLIRNYFKYNFISTVTIITIKDYTASITSTFSNDPNFIIENLQKENDPTGFPSIYNALQACVEYLYLIDKMNNDIVFFYSSQNSFDRGNVYNLIDILVETKTEVHFFTFENPFELMHTIALSTGGVLYKSSEPNDINAFMNYLIFKKAMKVKTPFKVQLPKLQISNSHNILCWCHNQLNNTYYHCGECLIAYCKLPTHCKQCSSLLLNDLFLYQLRNANIGDTQIESFDIITIPNLYNDFYHDKTIRFPDRKTLFNIDEYYNFRSRYFENFKNITCRRDSSRSLSIRSEGSQREVEKEADSVLNQVKMMLLFIKFIIGDKVYSNADNFLLFKNNIDEFSNKTAGLFARDTIYCIGCEISLDKIKSKSIPNYASFLVCMKCGETLCQNCTEYLKNNNLGCLNCANL